MVLFSSSAEIRDSNMFGNCEQYLCLFHTVFEYIPGRRDQGKMWFSLSISLLSTFHIGLVFVSFQPILCHPHTQMRITLFHGVRISIHNWKPSPNRAAIGFSQIAFPTTDLPEDDRTDSFREERLGHPYWTMILAICASVDVSKYLDILSRILHLLLVLNILEALKKCP